ncbi:hypothetical protein Dimus_010611, partial [Dionaea muscipula]
MEGEEHAISSVVLLLAARVQEEEWPMSVLVVALTAFSSLLARALPFSVWSRWGLNEGDQSPDSPLHVKPRDSIKKSETH